MILFIILAPITSIGTLIGGMFGPIGIISYCLILSIPAWLTWLIVRGRVAREIKSRRLDGDSDGE